MPPESWRVERVTAEQTQPLRQQVLRPHQHLDDVGFPGEDDPHTAYFGAFATAVRIIGVVTILRQCPLSWPAPGPDPTWWRLRGMATAENHRNAGAGSALVAAAVAHVAAQHGTVLWCYARMTAVPFYRKASFVAIGDPWDEPPLGLHLAMWRTVP